MAVKIRMKRLGAKKRPFYRIVVADSRAPRNGRFIEEIGFYDPISRPRQFRVNADKAKEWIANGAKPTDTVAHLFENYKVLETEGMVCEGLPTPKRAAKPVEKETAPAEVKEAEEVEQEEPKAEAEPARNEENEA